MLKSIRCFVGAIALFGGFWAFSAPVTPFSEWFADAVAAYVGGESAGWSGETMSVTNTSHIAIDAPAGVSYAIPVQATDSYVSETIQIIADPQEWEDLPSPSSDELEGAKFAVCIASKDDALVYAVLVKTAPSESATWLALSETPAAGANTVTVQYNRNSNTVRFPDLDDRLFYALPASGSALTRTTFLGVGELCSFSGQQTTANNAAIVRPAVAANGEATTLSFAYNNSLVYRGTDGSWSTTANWFTGNEEDGWTVLGTNYPQKQGAGPYTPFLFDGDIMMRAGATKDAESGYYEVTCEELMEGWETRIAVYGGVHVSSTQGFTKLQGGVGNKWFFVDKDSKLTINHTRAGQTNNDLELHTAAPDGIEWTGNWSASPTVKYFFEGEGSVAYKAGLTVGTHQIHKFDLKLNEPSEVKYVAKKYLVNFGSEGSYTSTFALIDTPAVTLYEADGSVSETAVVKKDAVTETEAVGTYAIGQDAKGVYISFVNYAVPLPTEAFKFVGNSTGGTVSGWFDAWGGETFAPARLAIGPGAYGLVPVADHIDNGSNKWHPYKSFQLPEAFTLSIYTDLSLVTNATKKAAIWAAGQYSGNRVILSKLDDTLVVDTSSTSVSAALPETKGYHLYTVMFSTTEGVKIAIDGKVCASDATPANRPVNGFQIGAVFQGVQDKYVTPQVLPVAAMVGYESVIDAAQLAQLARAYPATAEAAGSDLTYATQNGRIFVGTMTCSKRVDINRGTLLVPAGQTYSAPALRFGNAQTDGENGTFGLELDGKIVIRGESAKAGHDHAASSIREAVLNDEGGFLGGEWEGVGTYNIRGTLEVLGSYVQLCHDAHAQTYNIENGGVMKVKGFQAGTYGNKARSSHVLNIKNGGQVVSTEGFTRGSLTAVVEAGGVLEISAGTATVDMVGSDLSGISGGGKLTLNGTNWISIPSDSAKVLRIAELENNLSNGILLKNATEYVIPSLSGSGDIRGDWDSGARTIAISQSKNTTWTGGIYGDSNSGRVINVKVGSENGTALTLSGNFLKNNARTGTLTVEEGGTVNLQTKWPTAGFIVDGTLNIGYDDWIPVYLVKGAGTINWAGTNTFSVNAADGADALIVEGTTINQTAGTLSLRAPGNRTADAAPDAIGYLKDATIISSSTLACSGKVGVKGACSITKTAGSCSISTIELSETEAVLTLTGVEMTVTSGVAGYRVQETDGAEGAKVYTLVPDRIVIAPGASADIVAASAEAAIAQATIDAPEALKPALQLIATEGAEDGHWTVTVDLNPEAVVEGVPVVPELAQVTVAEESVKPMALVDPDAVFGVKTIAGLWYAVEASATSDFASVTRTTPVQAIGSATKLTADLGTETVRYYRIVVSATEAMK